MKLFLIGLAIAFGVVLVYLSSPSPSDAVSTPVTRTAVSRPVISDNGSGQAERYVACLGITRDANKLWTSTRGDMTKFLIAIHMVMTGDVTDTPLTPRERTCRKSTGL